MVGFLYEHLSTNLLGRIITKNMETKKCKQCQTDIPKKAKKCPNCQSDQRSWFNRHPFLVILLALFLIFVFSVGKSANKVAEEDVSGVTAPVTTASNQNKLPNIGSEGTVSVVGQNQVLLTRTQEAQEKFSKAALAKDTTGLTELVLDGEAFFVKSGTKVLVIDRGSLGVRKIRVLDGDFAGETGYLPMEYIKVQ